MSMEFYNVTTPKARKRHVCEACGRVIEVGETYQRETGKWEGDFFSRAQCLDCANVMDYWTTHLATENEFDYDGVQDDIREKFCYDCAHGWHSGEDDCPVDTIVWHCQRIQSAISSKQDGVPATIPADEEKT